MYAVSMEFPADLENGAARMGLYKRPDRDGWWFSVTIRGRRFREPCGTPDKAAANLIYRRRRDELRRRFAEGQKHEIALGAALIRYWDEHAARLSSADDIKRMGKILAAGLGATTLLSELTRDGVATFAARRRSRLSDSSVNRELTMLRALLRMAAQQWGCAVTEIDWKHQMFREPPPRDRFLSIDEERRLFAALRSDFHPLVRFAMLSGVRVSNARLLRWEQIAWDEGIARLRVKSKRPGGDTQTVVITSAMRAILSAERGRHPVYVFTFVARRARSEAGKARELEEGRRYPFTRDGWRKAWGAALAEAGISDLRFHDLRHTFGTRLYRLTGDIRKVQKAIGHRDISSTLRYENSGVEDIRAAMELLSPSPAIAGKRKRK
jgi:integrase